MGPEGEAAGTKQASLPLCVCLHGASRRSAMVPLAWSCAPPPSYVEASAGWIRMCSIVGSLCGW